MPAPDGVSAAAPLPGLRAAGFAALAVTVSLSAHLSAGGAHPDRTTLLAAPVLVHVVHRTALGRAPRSRLLAVLALLAAELGLHLLFEATTMLPAAVPDDPATAGTAGMPGITGMAEMAGMDHAPHHPTTAASAATMVVLHLISALVMGLLLHHGDEALAGLARHSGHAVARLHRGVRRVVVALAVRPAAVLAAQRTTAGPDDERPGRRSWLPHCRPPGHRLVLGGRYWRGPPVLRRVVPWGSCTG